MTADQQLARIVRMLQASNVDLLVMGGHAVRYYGIDRNTVDFDLVTSVISTDELRLRLTTIPGLENARHEPAWRSRDFARFEIGRLPNGRSEYLEFWLRNHLLDDFSQLKLRAEMGEYGGARIPFLSLGDVIRSKETERESDWADIALLEEIQDARMLGARQTGSLSTRDALSRLRSRRGMDEALTRHLLDAPAVAADAIAACDNPMGYAFLAPFTHRSVSALPAPPMEGPWLDMLSTLQSGSPRHFAVVEIVRRAYKRNAMDADRADKQRHLE